MNNDFGIDCVNDAGMLDKGRLECLQRNRTTWVSDWRAGSRSFSGSVIGYATCFDLGSATNTEETGFILNNGKMGSVWQQMETGRRWGNGKELEAREGR